MKLRTILLSLLLACAAQGQTLKSLMYNTTNGFLAYTSSMPLILSGTSLMIGDVSHSTSGIDGGGFSGELDFEENQFTAGDGDWDFMNSGINNAGAISFNATSNAATTRTNLGLGATWLTNTNVTNFRTAIGFGTNDNVRFADIFADNIEAGIGTNSVSFGAVGIDFAGIAAAATRTNLGLPLAALTNDSNVTMMRALSGSTNTNHPFSGTVSVVGTNNTNTLVFSNGILQSVQ